MKDTIIDGIHSGRYSVERLPKDLYLQTADKLKAKVYKGFGSSLKDVADDKLAMLTDLRESTYMFAGAKTFQQVNELSDALVSEGRHLSLSEYREVAGKIYDRYNDDWQRVEEDTAQVSARSAEQWVDIKNEAKEYPFLIYAVDTETACDICEPLDGIILPEDDPFWDENATPQHFNCNCTIGQLTDRDVEEAEGVSSSEEVDKALSISQRDKNPMFNFNAGKEGAIFKETGENKHPYYDIPEKYKAFAENNFNLPIPETDE